METSRYCPYFKPTRRKHDSRFLIMEVGYCMGDGYLPVGRCSDVIHLYPLFDPTHSNEWHLNIDVADYGYFRIFGDKEVKWSFPVLSSAILEEGAPDYKALEEQWKKYKEERNKK